MFFLADFFLLEQHLMRSDMFLNFYILIFFLKILSPLLFFLYKPSDEKRYSAEKPNVIS